jgi:hypothetical protein
MSVLLAYRVLKAYIISKSDFFISRMSVLTYVADTDEHYSIVNSEVPVYSSWGKFLSLWTRDRVYGKYFTLQLTLFSVLSKLVHFKPWKCIK